MIYGEHLEWSGRIGRGQSAVRYMDHVRQLLPALHTEESTTAEPPFELPPNEYIGEGPDGAFRELIGLRLRGHPNVLLAALRFDREEGAMVEFGRESLPYYLSAPHRNGNGGVVGSLDLMLPDPDEPVPDFLRALRRGEDRPIVQVDPAQVQFAFDFRTVNPSPLSKIRPDHTHPRPTAFRTTEGHILVGATKNLARRLAEGPDYLVLLNPVQRTSQGTHMLPTLVLHRSFVAAAAEAPEPEDERSLERLLPFNSATGVSRPLLF